jgi:hypothetical protein
MEAAENMLKYSDFSLSDISEILHFASYSHFAKIFRKYYNTSPKAYRNSHYRKTAMTEQVKTIFEQKKEKRGINFVKPLVLFGYFGLLPYEHHTGLDGIE